MFVVLGSIVNAGKKKANTFSGKQKEVIFMPISFKAGQSSKKLDGFFDVSEEDKETIAE